MAFTDTRNLTARPGPIVAVIAIHAGLGFALVTGLATSVATIIIDDFEAIEFPTKPPEKVEDPVPPPPTSDSIEYKPRIEDPPIKLKSDSSTKIEVGPLPPIIDEFPLRDLPTIGPKPVPSPRFDPVLASPSNNPARWVTTDDYPTSEIRRGNEGLARFRLEIAANGKVESCTITRSSGHERLDAATCKNIERRAKFDPAKDSNGNPVSGTYESSVRWTLPE